MEDYKASVEFRKFILEKVKEANSSGEITADQAVDYIYLSGKLVSLSTPSV